jgi:hypothetical protein
MRFLSKEIRKGEKFLTALKLEDRVRFQNFVGTTPILKSIQMIGLRAVFFSNSARTWTKLLCKHCLLTMLSGAIYP